VQVPREHGALVAVMEENTADPARVIIGSNEHVLPPELALALSSTTRLRLVISRL
jgi:hypothetical protein